MVICSPCNLYAIIAVLDCFDFDADVISMFFLVAIKQEGTVELVGFVKSNNFLVNHLILLEDLDFKTSRQEGKLKEVEGF